MQNCFGGLSFFVSDEICTSLPYHTGRKLPFPCVGSAGKDRKTLKMSWATSVPDCLICVLHLRAYVHLCNKDWYTAGFAPTDTFSDTPPSHHQITTDIPPMHWHAEATPSLTKTQQQTHTQQQHYKPATDHKGSVLKRTQQMSLKYGQHGLRAACPKGKEKNSWTYHENMFLGIYCVVCKRLTWTKTQRHWNAQVQE